MAKNSTITSDKLPSVSHTQSKRQREEGSDDDDVEEEVTKKRVRRPTERARAMAVEKVAGARQHEANSQRAKKKQKKKQVAEHDVTDHDDEYEGRGDGQDIEDDGDGEQDEEGGMIIEVCTITMWLAYR